MKNKITENSWKIMRKVFSLEYVLLGDGVECSPASYPAIHFFNALKQEQSTRHIGAFLKRTAIAYH